MLSKCPCFATGRLHVNYNGYYVIIKCPNCPVPRKKGRLTSLPVTRPKTNPRNKAYLKRRLRSNYVSNTGDPV